MLADNADTHLKGALYLDLKVHHVLFNQKGKYHVKFSISGSRGDLCKVKLYLNNSKQSIFEYEYTSEPCYQDSSDIPCQLDDNQFRFEMPEEFSEGEVFLLFETYQFTDNPVEEPFKCGEGKCLVFPCASPMLSDQPSTSTDIDICYNYTTQIVINKLLREEQLYINVGHVQITVLLKIDQVEGNKTGYTSCSVGTVQPLHNIISEEHEPKRGFDHNFDTEAIHVSTNSENNSLVSDTVCTSQMNSLHVNPGSKEDISEGTGDISGNISDCDSQRIQTTQDVEDRQEREYLQGRRDAFNESSSYSSSVQPEAVDTRKDREFSQVLSRKVTDEHSSHSSNLRTETVTTVTRQRKEYPKNRKATLTSKVQHSTEKKWSGSKEQDMVTKSKAGQMGKDQTSNFDKGRTNEELSRNMSLSSKKMVNDAALASNMDGPSTRHLCGSHLNEVGVYEVVIQVHSACDLPSNTQGRPPQPYVTGNVTNSAGGSSNTAVSQCATHATLHPTYSPLWEELLVVKVPKENFAHQELILNVTDHRRNILITGYRLPLEPLKPFYPYHLELEQTGSESKAKLFITLMLKTDELILSSLQSDVFGLETGSESKAKLFITLMLKTDELILSSLQSDVFGLEVVLRDFASSVAAGFTDPFIATLRIIPDSSQYRERFVNAKQRDGYVRTRKLRVPSTDLASSLKSMYDENQYNVPQVTFAGKPVEQPRWDQMFFFYGDHRWLFTSSSALVIEYFNALQVVSFGRWQPRTPIGYSILDLDESLLNVLKQDNATMGVRVDNITVNESSLRDKSGSLVTVNVILRLLTSKRPDHMFSSTYFHILPIVDAIAKQPQPLQRNVAQISSGQPKVSTGVDSTVFSVMEHQTKELDKHRYAMKRMADDILKLKSEATRLQAANGRLRLALEHRGETNQSVTLPLQLENTTHAELVQRIVIIKGSLDEQTAINRELKLEIQSLQNQLIKKNEKEKDMYKLQEAHKNQQMLLQKMQERLRRTKTLEETCKRQEKVIIRLEDFLANSKAKEKGKKNEDEQAKTAEETLSDENKRLKTLVLNYERTSKAVEDMDRLQVHDKLRRAEGRVAALEKELLDNTRRWARDKAELQLKLSETQILPQSGQWQYPNLSQEPFSLFDRTPPDSVTRQNHSRLSSPKLSPLTRK